MKTSKKNYGPMDREAMEKAEGGQIKTGLSDARFQSEIQVDDPSSMINKAGDESPSGKKLAPDKAAEVIGSKMKVKPAADVSLLSDEQVGGVPIGAGQAAVLSAAGLGQQVSTVDDQSKIPYTEGGYRPNPRFAKKTSDNDFLINNAISEQIAPKFEGTKDLRESPDSLQGYNGQKQFTVNRGKKNDGDAPQSTLFDRSVDYVEFDATVHTTGQVLSNIPAESDYPTLRYNNELNGGNGGYEAIDNPMHKSNYLLKGFRITFDDNGITGFSFNEDEIDAPIREGNSYQANLNHVVDRNNVAKSVLKLQRELGRETTDKWSPLGYVIEEPYQYNMIAHDIEATTGAIQLAAYRFANTSLAHTFNNVLAKDGAKPVYPITEAFLGGIGRLSQSITHDNEIADGNLRNTVFNTSLYRQGSAAAMIEMFDSVGKYQTKANFINMPRSLKYMVQTADNNINPLHCKKQFLMALDTMHCYSTPDGEYNPLLPIYATDKITLVNPLSLNYFCQGWSKANISNENPAGTVSPYVYSYADIRNHYDWVLRHPIVDGLIKWCLKHEQALMRVYHPVNGEGEVTVTIPAFFSAQHPSMFQMMLCAASQEILWTRNITFRDFLFAGEQSEYIWPDLTSLSELNPKYSSNMTITDYKTPLKVGKMKPATFIQIMWGESFQVINYTDAVFPLNNYSTLYMPWYMNEESLNPEVNQTGVTEFSGFLRESEQAYRMSYPELRCGVRHEYIDYVYSMSERDLRLALDRMIDIPVRANAEDVDGNDGVQVYRQIELGEDDHDHVYARAIRYDYNSDGRIAVTYRNRGSSDEDNLQLNKAGVYCQARELGFIYPKFLGQPIIDPSACTHRVNQGRWIWTLTNYGFYRMHDVLDGSCGVSIKSYRATGGQRNTTRINRTAALQQDFICCFAERSAECVALNQRYVAAIGIVPAFSALVNPSKVAANANFNATNATLNPYYGLGSVNHLNEDNLPSVITLSRYTWTMMNRLFIPVNYFENCFISGTSSVASSGAIVDPFESAFQYGLCGFFASDFSQDVLSRADVYDQSPLDYTEDIFVKDSLIFRAD